MNTYSIYKLETGFFTGVTIQCMPDHLALNVADDCGCILGTYDVLSERVDLESGQVVDYQPTQPSPNHEWDSSSKRWVYVPTMDDKKAEKKAQINAKCTALLYGLVKSYPQDEIQSWPQQLSEAKAYRAGDTNTPLLTALSESRGVALDELVNRVLAKADMFAAASGQIIGTRQKYTDQIDAATTADGVEGITWID